MHWGDWSSGCGSVAGGKMITCRQRDVWVYATGITNEQLCHAFPIFLMGLGSLQSYEKHNPPIKSTGESPTQVDRGNLRQTPAYVSTHIHIYWSLQTYIASNMRWMPMHPTINVYLTVMHLLVLLQRFFVLLLSVSSVTFEKRVQRWQEIMLCKRYFFFIWICLVSFKNIETSLKLDIDGFNLF